MSGACLRGDAGSWLGGDAGSCQQVAHQFKSHERAVQCHQLLLQRWRQRQQLAPAIGQPAAIVEAIGLGEWHRHMLFTGLGALTLERLHELAQCQGGVLQVGGNRMGQIVVEQFGIGRPQSVLLQRAVPDAKALRTVALYLQQAGLWRCKLADDRQGADGGKPFSAGAGSPHLATGGQADDAKRRAGLVAAPDHVEVANLENAQRQQTTRKQHAAEREKRQVFRDRSFGQRREPFASVSSHRVRRLHRMFNQIPSFLLDVIVGLFGGACLLRWYMQVQRVPFGNPLGRFVFAVTDWIVMPLRRVVPAARRWDFASAVAAFLLVLAKFLLLMLLAEGAVRLAVLPLVSLVGLLQLIVSGLTALLILYAVLSWIPSGSSLLQELVGRLAVPLVQPLRRFVPLIGGVDLSALVAIVLLQVAAILLGNLMVWAYALPA